jgi:hypothetical protein
MFFLFGNHGHQQPSADDTNAFVCVRQDHVRSIECSSLPHVWCDSGSHASYDLEIGELPHGSLWVKRTTFPGINIREGYTFQANLPSQSSTSF